MIRILQFFIIAFLATTFHANAYFSVADSIGITKKADKTFIIHQIVEGETLYSLSRRYNVKVDEIKQENPETKNGLKIGQKVLVPYIKPFTETLAKGDKMHTVQQSETLYSIAREYEVSVNELKEWNNLSENTIDIGDQLVIKGAISAENKYLSSAKVVSVDYSGRKIHSVEPSETMYSISKKYDISVDELKAWNNLSTNELSVGQVLIVGESKSTPTASANSSMLPPSADQTASIDSTATASVKAPEVKTPEVKIGPPNSARKTYDNKKVIENGFAEVIEGSSETKKYLALHRTAPIGTIMQIRNDMNNQTVFVRVVGTIPGTDNNNKVLIKISKKAFDRLGAVDQRFPVEISYIP